MNTPMIIGIVVALIVLFWLISTNNWFRRTEVKIDEAYSSIDVILQQRFDSLENMYGAAKAYLNEEVKVMIETTKYRTGMTPEEMAKANEELNQCVQSMSAVVENYPELKASGLFANLQDTIRETEDNLQAVRRIYNSNVSMFNQKLVTFPSSIVGGGMLHLTKKGFFKADEAAKKKFKIPY